MNKKVISESRLREIISEEALRMKKRLQLESEKKKLLKRLHEMYMEEEMIDSGIDQIDSVEAEVKIKPEVEAKIADNLKKVISKLSPEQIAQAQADVQNMQDVEVVSDKVEDILSEALLAEAFDKKKFYTTLRKAGIGAMLGGILVAALGALPMEQAANLADYTGANVPMTATTIAGLVTTALGMAGTLIGAKGEDKYAK